MQDLDHKFTADHAVSEYAEKRAAALEAIRAKDLSQQATGHALMAGVMGFGESAYGGSLTKIVHGSKLFLIGFAFLVPNLLLIRTVF